MMFTIFEVRGPLLGWGAVEKDTARDGEPVRSGLPGAPCWKKRRHRTSSSLSSLPCLCLHSAYRCLPLLNDAHLCVSLPVAAYLCLALRIAAFICLLTGPHAQTMRPSIPLAF